MRGRKPNPDSPNNVILHVANGYRYAATVHTVHGEDGRRTRKYIHWGTVSADNIFKPNMTYMMAQAAEKERLRFPGEWDISAAGLLNKPADNAEERKPDGENSGQGQEDGGLALPAPSFSYENRLYGSVWLLCQIASGKKVIDDLMTVFEHNEEAVNIILTMAIFPYLTRRNFDRLASCQDVYRFPAETRLTPGVITRFTQHILDRHRMEFCKLRMDRQPEGAYAACDSTTRGAWGECLADIHFGRNKDNKEMDCTLEVVVYSLTTHEPVYYRTFAGNTPDARTVQTISDDLRNLGASKVITIYDRGYESEGNFDEFFMKDLPFISCAKVAQEPVIDCLEQIAYDSSGLPTNMGYDEELGLYYAQFMLDGREYSDAKGEKKAVAKEDYRCNVYLDPRNRLPELRKVCEAMKKEKERLLEMQEAGRLVAEKKTVNKSLRYHKVKFATGEDGAVQAEITEDGQKICKAKSACGFFSSVTYKAPGDPLEMLRLYKTRDEQEKYFEQMKDQMDFHTQDSSSEDGKAGREFILFIGLILSSTLRNTWKRDLELRKIFKTSLAVLDEMEKIRLYEYPDGTRKMTGFIGPQLQICKSYGLKVPENCLPAVEKKAVEKKKNPAKRGRKPKDSPPPHKVVPIQIGV